MSLNKEVGLGPSDIVLYGDPGAPRQKGGTAPNFRPMSSSQTAGWTKMPLGTETGLDLGNIVLDGGPAPPKRLRRHLVWR